MKHEKTPPFRAGFSFKLAGLRGQTASAALALTDHLRAFLASGDAVTEAFEDFYFRVCTLDYSRMQPGMKALAELMMTTGLMPTDGAHVEPETERFHIR